MYKSYRTKVLILREYYNNGLVRDNLLTMDATYPLLELSHIFSHLKSVKFPVFISRRNDYHLIPLIILSRSNIFVVILLT